MITQIEFQYMHIQYTCMIIWHTLWWNNGESHLSFFFHLNTPVNFLNIVLTVLTIKFILFLSQRLSRSPFALVQIDVTSLHFPSRWSHPSSISSSVSNDTSSLAVCDNSQLWCVASKTEPLPLHQSHLLSVVPAQKLPPVPRSQGLPWTFFSVCGC